MSKFYYGIVLIVLALLIYSCEEDNPTTPEVSVQTISGSATDNFDEPLANTIIEAYTESSSSSKKDANSLQSINIISKDTTDEFGNFDLTDIPENMDGILVRVENEDFVPMPLENAIKEDSKFSLKLQRREDCDIEVTFDVKDSKGASIKNAKVQLKRDGKEVRNSKTDENGLANILEVCPDDYELRIFSEGFETIEEEFEITEKLEKSFVLQSKEKDEDDEDEKDSCCGGSLKVTIKDTDGNPIEGVKVLIKHDGKAIEDPRTNADGVIELDSLCEGDYRIIATKEGYSALEYDIEIGCDESVESEYKMEPKKEEEDCCDGLAEILVEDKEGNALDSAFVIIKKGGKEVGKVITEDDGKARFDSLCEGNYAIVIERAGYERISWEVKIDCDEDYEATKALEKNEDKEECCESVLQIKITDKDGKAIANTKVKIWKDGKAIKEAKSNSEGWIKIEDFCEGSYGVDISHENYEDIEFEFEIGCEEEKTIEKTLEKVEEECCDGVLKVNIKDKDGNPVKDAKVLLKKDGKAIEDPRTNGDGDATIDGLCEGNYVLIISKDGMETIEKEIEIDCDNIVEQEYTLEGDKECCDALAEILVQDENGNALDSAYVILKKGGKEVKSYFTSTDGKASFEDLCEGNYAIVIERSSYERISWEAEIKCEKKYESTKKLEKNEKEECCESTLQIKVTDKDGKAIADAKVKIWKDGKVIRDAKSNGDGWIKFEEFCEGDFWADITHEDYEDIEFEFEIGCGVEKTIEKSLEKIECCESEIQIRLQDQSGNNLDSAYVTIKKDGKQVGFRASNSDGLVEFEELCEGNYNIIIERSGYKTLSYEIELGCNKTYEATKKLESDECCDVKIKVYAKDKDSDEIIADATVKYILDGKVVAEGKTNADGYFIEDGLCKGKYTIEITANGYNAGSWTWNIEKCDDFQETFKLSK